MQDLIEFAGMVNGVVKFIDLASCNDLLVVPVDRIIARLKALGFIVTDSGEWQVVMAHDHQKVIITRCGFTPKNRNKGFSNLFINPDGSLFSDGHNGVTISILREIKERNTGGVVKKIACYFPPATEQ